MNKKIIQINQTEIDKLKFKSNDVLETEKARKERKRKLKIAVMRKKREGGTVSLILESAKRGLFRVDSLVLMAGRDFVMLAGGTTLPVKSIKKIKL
ncbi:MAG: hypothetical protein KDC84_12155 [Crocinitomicaceae bacterium]|nr:hypothetical protein [Crocinitomicaceae bacterium]